MNTKKKSLSKLIGVLCVALLILCVPFCFAGCGDKSKQFVGSYRSVYSDIYKETTNYAGVAQIGFELTINKDKTFSLKKLYDNPGLQEKNWTVSGTYTTITENGETTMICFMDEKPNGDSYDHYKPYFSLTFDDNSNLLATPIYSPSYGSAFGNGITLVVFEKV